MLFHVVHFYPLRLYLAGIHYNENAQRKQAVTKQGEEQYSALFPKYVYKKGSHTVRKVLEGSSYGMCTISGIPSCIHSFCKSITLTINYNTTLVHFLLSHIEYVEELLTKLWAIAEDTCNKCARRIPEVNPSPPLRCRYENPVKSQAIKVHKSHFTRGKKFP